MSAVISPTILADDPHNFRTQIERVAPFAERIQIDLTDGKFAPTTTVTPIQVWWPPELTVDIHMMFARPLEHLETLVSLQPNLVIIHAEAEGDLAGIIDHLHKLHMKAGIALLKETTPESAKDLITIADHVLLFSGDLGKFGGQADMKVLDKVADVRAINPHIEIGWDGGANESNVVELRDGGVDVINIGGAIQRADDPQAAYATLVAKVAE